MATSIHTSVLGAAHGDHSLLLTEAGRRRAVPVVRSSSSRSRARIARRLVRARRGRGRARGARRARRAAPARRRACRRASAAWRGGHRRADHDVAEQQRQVAGIGRRAIGAGAAAPAPASTSTAIGVDRERQHVGRARRRPGTRSLRSAISSSSTNSSDSSASPRTPSATQHALGQRGPAVDVDRRRRPARRRRRPSRPPLVLPGADIVGWRRRVHGVRACSPDVRRRRRRARRRRRCRRRSGGARRRRLVRCTKASPSMPVEHRARGRRGRCGRRARRPG